MHLTAAASPPPFTAHPPPAPPRVDARPWLQLSMIFANQSEADIILKVLCVFVFLFVCLFWGAEG